MYIVKSPRLSFKIERREEISKVFGLCSPSTFARTLSIKVSTSVLWQLVVITRSYDSSECNLHLSPSREHQLNSILYPRSCPDLTTTTLSHEDGAGLLKIIRTIVHSAQTFKNAENYFPIISEEFDKYSEIDRAGTRNDLPQRRAIRMYQTIDSHGELAMHPLSVTFEQF